MTAVKITYIEGLIDSNISLTEDEENKRTVAGLEYLEAYRMESN